MSTYVFKAMDLAGGKARGEVEAESKQAVSDQLQAARPDRPRDRRQAPLARDQHRRFLKRVKLQRPRRLLAPARDDGVLRHERSCARCTCSRSRRRQEAEGRDRARAQGRRGGPVVQRRAEPPPEGLQPAVHRDGAAGEIGGVLEDSLVRVADQLREGRLLRRQVNRRWSTRPSCSSVALSVMIALVVFLVPVFAGVFKQFATASRVRAAGDDAGHRRCFARRSPATGGRFIGGTGRDHPHASPGGSNRQPGPAPVGPLRLQDADEDRRRSSRRSRSRAGRARSPR